MRREPVVDGAHQVVMSDLELRRRIAKAIHPRELGLAIDAEQPGDIARGAVHQRAIVEVDRVRIEVAAEERPEQHAALWRPTGPFRRHPADRAHRQALPLWDDEPGASE